MSIKNKSVILLLQACLLVFVSLVWMALRTACVITLLTFTLTPLSLFVLHDFFHCSDSPFASFFSLPPFLSLSEEANHSESACSPPKVKATM